jgi:hypothetical protein
VRSLVRRQEKMEQSLDILSCSQVYGHFLVYITFFMADSALGVSSRSRMADSPVDRLNNTSH